MVQSELTVPATVVSSTIIMGLLLLPFAGRNEETDILTFELFAVKRGLEMAKTLALNSILISSDSRYAVSLIQRAIDPPWKLRRLLFDINSLWTTVNLALPSLPQTNSRPSSRRETLRKMPEFMKEKDDPHVGNTDAGFPSWSNNFSSVSEIEEENSSELFDIEHRIPETISEEFEIRIESFDLRNGEDNIYVAVGKSDSSMDALLWALKHSVKPSSFVYLIHIFPEIRHIPTP
ncbi:hypothetical protein HHK36_005836 [Tetracentron sinense]|uniref:Uncharacterized protein n=1 Tax=Tetracentron sinense TaxID=13715 RepID=A0A835DRE0_TETSI|nr:hypothetical protein HHK36_005836 [Tetracentron sinense]